MPILQDASKDERRRLLELFPVAVLRKGFEIVGTKDNIAADVADDVGPDQIQKIILFVEKNLGCCKQHVYVFPDEPVPEDVFNVERVSVTDAQGLFLAKERYSVFVPDPLRMEQISFLWPIKVERIAGYLVVRFIVLEKNVSALFGEAAKVTGKLLTEEGILDSWGLTENLRVDLNKGIKQLWQDDWMDCFRGQYKKAFSTSLEKMDGNRSIKKEYSAIYKDMMVSPIHTSGFRISDDALKLDVFSVNPTEGTIGFPTYSQPGDSDAIIRKILESNQ
jgi:hypothetical protein